MKAHFKVCAHCMAIFDGTRNIVKLVGMASHVNCLPVSAGPFAIRLTTPREVTVWLKYIQDLSACDLAEGERLLLSEQEQWSTTG
jgi:hypothetical protein